MHIWTLEKWKKHYDSNYKRRTGVYLRFDKDVNSEVRRACKEFVAWLRTEYYFPIRVLIYVKATKRIQAIDGDMVTGTFFIPCDRNVEPYARVSTGDYLKLKDGRGQDNAIAAILHSIAHELTHYFQWINDINLTEIGLERQATTYAGFILEEYAETRDHP